MGNRGRASRQGSAVRFVSGGLACLFVLLFQIPLFPHSPVRHPLTESPSVSTATREGRLAVFDDVWSTINERYYDRTFRGLDWSAQRASFRPLVAEAQTGQEFYALLRRMLSSLNDPHTRVFAPDEKFDWWHPRVITTGLTIREVAGRPTVVQVDRGSPAEHSGMRAGDQIEAVNGEPWASIVQSRLGALSSESASARGRVFSRLLEGPLNTLVEVSWKTKGDKQRSVRLMRYWKQRELGLHVNRKSGGYAIVEIDVFTKGVAVDFSRALKGKLKNVRGLVIDLRNNGGGDAQAMADIASAFFGEGTNLGQFTDRSGRSFGVYTNSRLAIVPERLDQTRIPLLVLTSERTSSASEIFVAGLKSSRRATILGTPTCGCVLAIRSRHELPDGGVLDVSELDYQTASGERLEGNGIKPDQNVSVTRDDLYSRRDRTMELALTELSKLQPQR